MAVYPSIPSNPPCITVCSSPPTSSTAAVKSAPRPGIEPSGWTSATRCSAPHRHADGSGPRRSRSSASASARAARSSVVVEPSGRIAQQRRQDLALEDLSIHVVSAEQLLAQPRLQRPARDVARPHVEHAGGDGRRGHVAVPAVRAAPSASRSSSLVGSSASSDGSASRAGSDTVSDWIRAIEATSCTRDVLQPLHDATRPVRRVEVVADQVRVVVVVDPVVRRHEVPRSRDRPPTAARRTGSTRPTRARRSSPGTGPVPSPARRTGYRPVHW